MAARDELVVALEHRDVAPREGLARGVDVLVHVLGLGEGDHQTAHLRVREHPPEGRLGVGVGLALELRHAAVLGPLQHLHGDDAHVGGVRPVDELAEPRPGAVVVREHHHVEATVGDGVLGHGLEVGSVAGEAEEADLARFLQLRDRFVEVGRLQPFAYD